MPYGSGFQTLVCLRIIWGVHENTWVPPPEMNFDFQVILVQVVLDHTMKYEKQ